LWRKRKRSADQDAVNMIWGTFVLAKDPSSANARPGILRELRTSTMTPSSAALWNCTELLSTRDISHDTISWWSPCMRACMYKYTYVCEFPEAEIRAVRAYCEIAAMTFPALSSRRQTSTPPFAAALSRGLVLATSPASVSQVFFFVLLCQAVTQRALHRRSSTYFYKPPP